MTIARVVCYFKEVIREERAHGRREEGDRGEGRRGEGEEGDRGKGEGRMGRGAGTYIWIYSPIFHCDFSF